MIQNNWKSQCRELVKVQEVSGDGPDGADTNPSLCRLIGHLHTHTPNMCVCVKRSSQSAHSLPAVAETALSLQYEQ